MNFDEFMPDQGQGGSGVLEILRLNEKPTLIASLPRSVRRSAHITSALPT